MAISFRHINNAPYFSLNREAMLNMCNGFGIIAASPANHPQGQPTRSFKRLCPTLNCKHKRTLKMGFGLVKSALKAMKFAQGIKHCALIAFALTSLKQSNR